MSHPKKKEENLKNPKSQETVAEIEVKKRKDPTSGKLRL